MFETETCLVAGRSVQLNSCVSIMLRKLLFIAHINQFCVTTFCTLYSGWQGVWIWSDTTHGCCSGRSRSSSQRSTGKSKVNLHLLWQVYDTGLIVLQLQLSDAAVQIQRRYCFLRNTFLLFLARLIDVHCDKSVLACQLIYFCACGVLFLGSNGVECECSSRQQLRPHSTCAGGAWWSHSRCNTPGQRTVGLQRAVFAQWTR